jgi:hypothetical protein
MKKLKDKELEKIKEKLCYKKKIKKGKDRTDWRSEEEDKPVDSEIDC